MKEKVLITGTAGFIGYHTALKFLAEGYQVVGLDNINNYYDVNVKLNRLADCGLDANANQDSCLTDIQAKYQADDFDQLHPAAIKVIKEDSLFEYAAIYQSSKFKDYRFIRLALEDYGNLKALFEKEKFDRVVHLAAQAGVRYSITNPFTYLDCNMNGHLNIMEACRHNKVKHLVYASSSSVYGTNTKMPLSTSDNIDHPISLYAATKKANELMSHTYSHLYQLPTTGLRFFTVYGPWGRPDMALFLFTKAMLEDKAIDVFNHGDMWRDFTYVKDIVEGVFRVTFGSYALKSAEERQMAPESDPSVSKSAPYKVYNIGNSSPVKLMDFIKAIEQKLGKTAKKNMMGMQAGDVPKTWADTTDLERDVDYKPDTSIEVGVGRFIDWYKAYYLGEAGS
jgi:UDP-glucuronate 4-epimerase